MTPQKDIKAGDLWLVEPGTSPTWPVLICDEDMVKQYFKRAGPKDWVPAMYVDSLKMIWAPRSRLVALDLKMAILQHSSNSDEKLAHAYGEVVELLERDALQYFKDKLYAKELSDRENSQHEGLGETITVSEVRRRKAIEASRSAIDDRSDIEDLSAFATKSKKINQEGVTAARTTTALSSSIPEYTDSHRSQEKMEYVDSNVVRIYVGNPYTIFTVKRTNLDASLYLQSITRYDPSHGWVAFSPTLADMDVADFAPVAEFLEYGEYNPSMVSVGTDHAYLNAVSSVREEEVIRCGVIFKIAQQLNLPGLQTLVLDKLKGLQPYPAYAFLVVARTAFGACLADDGLDKFLLEYLAEYYHDLVMAHGMLVMEVLDKHPRMEDRLRSIDSTTWSTEIGVIVGLTSGSAMSKDPTNDSDMRQGAEAQQEAIIDLTGPETSG